MKVGIIIICYNLDSRIFLLQMEAIKKFCRDDYTVEIFDNSTNPELSEAIRYHAEIRNISYRKTFARDLNGSLSHSWACNFAYQLLQKEYEIFLYFDHDLIPVRSFSITKILGEDKIFAGMGQGKNGITYFWPGIVGWNNTKVDSDLIDFNPEDGLDSGGKLHYAIEKYGKENCVFFNEAYHQNPYFNERSYSVYAMINDNMFLHCINTSNWNFVPKHEERINTLCAIIREKIDANVG
jgi:hypothetical protein